ncbi:3-(3-hydroxy-phenyl)propionate/3-hydroxycinnamic acid hydroxylase [Delftia tsuruhatensis]|uniref:FAD-dependent oxidoreductase n=1 Tax=Delftia tsuruhatensis TaxID=180282 RepID=UPI001E6B5BCF|nr:FAD-dependent oxidoreductase [Delftia tsuruhatensis]CAB5672654.1 3-(3-hydroxy-phenyl)propionate/3-hydroxycinnamic acid hydroxylase [Delftia tsuruhatensis]CAC9683480.1 3-(3-hydroxy-phenyl)propionate/3-hydroxycinnamic acid hydroxylase [Delftia tsuruhatensis]
MHQPHAQPRHSIYYRYQVHQPWLASQHPGAQRHSVVIVGGGPVGLTTALELARHGQRCVLLESEQQVSEGSRAIVFTRRSMEILQQVGVAGRVSESGLPWRFGNSIYRGQRVFRMEAPHDEDDRFSPMINLQQQYLEEFLVDAALAHPLIEMRWGNRVQQVRQVGGGADARVRLDVDTPEGMYVLEADWLVAADGARSGIRTAMGLVMEGASYEGRFVIADIRIDLPLPTERLAFFDPVWNPGNTILMHREPHGIWRVDYQLPRAEDPQQALQPQSLKQRIDAQLEMIGFGGTPWELDWSSVYSARALTLADYVHGRVVFTGDAAHLLPIFGVRGANTGLQDAQALAWRLALVARGVAAPTLLDSYSSERVGAAREIIEEAGKSTRFMAPPSRGFRLVRDAVLSLSLTQPFVRPLYHWRTSRPHAYADSPLNCLSDDSPLFAGGPGHGAPPQNVRLGSDDYLLDYLGGGFDLLYFTDGSPVAPSLSEVARAVRERGVALRIIAISSQTHCSHVQGADLTLADPQGRSRTRYGVPSDHPHGAACLLRPDQHVCARWLALEAQQLQSAIDMATGQQGAQA